MKMHFFFFFFFFELNATISIFQKLENVLPKSLKNYYIVDNKDARSC